MTAHFVNLLDELLRRSLRMASQVEDMLQEATEAVFQPVELLAQRVMSRDEEVDAEEVAVEAEVFRLLALYQPVGADLRLLCTILKVTSDLERIADCGVNIAERAKHLELQSIASQSEQLRQLCPMVRRMVRNAVSAYAHADADAAARVVGEDSAVDALYGSLVRDVVRNAQDVSGRLAAYLDMLSVAKNLERIADHATNIAEDVVFLRTGSIVRHRGERA